MKYKIDLHIHTNVNPHAYSTFQENVEEALLKKMEVIAITNHGPALQDSPHWWSLANMSVLPKEIKGLRILKGVEANILNEAGDIDTNQRVLDVMDIVIGGFHSIPEYGDTSLLEKNTNALINLMLSQKVDVLVHLGNPLFPIDYEKIVAFAAKQDIAIEINNSSLVNSRKGSKPNCECICALAKKYKTFISIGSDSHISYDIGEFTEAHELISKYEIDPLKILNTSKEILFNFLQKRERIKKELLKNIG